jgi:hypothetical protein
MRSLIANIGAGVGLSMLTLALMVSTRDVYARTCQGSSGGTCGNAPTPCGLKTCTGVNSCTCVVQKTNSKACKCTTTKPKG